MQYDVGLSVNVVFTIIKLLRLGGPMINRDILVS